MRFLRDTAGGKPWSSSLPELPRHLHGRDDECAGFLSHLQSFFVDKVGMFEASCAEGNRLFAADAV